MEDILFLAAYPDAEEAAHIEQCAVDLNQRHKLAGKLRPRRLLHGTLVDLSKLKDSPQQIIEKAIAAASLIRMQAFQVAFDRLQSFAVRDHYALVLTGDEGVAGIFALQKALIAGLHKQWLKVPAKSLYTPHMTLLYSRQALAEQAVPSISWRVRGFALIRSHGGESRHERLAEWTIP